ncbi:hypothetical protein HX071_08595 [Myroides marinus]|uniref:Uncharacterized protein n=1 Tax=Myroides odoratimimus TaxID=76832 RepID=A0AAI8C3H0_9FLAO|nr:MULTISPECIES: hypothetical protein [Myroides]ALU25267.1 hypothetical protein AS202_03440 [Myroides odoratimimus]MDM1502262.1 hypothetical protein [Myroides marinus]
MEKSKALIQRGDSTMDKLRAYYIDPDKHELSDHLEKLRNRYQHAYNLKMNYFSNKQIVTVWQKEYGLSQAQAYLDIRDALNLFGEVNKISKEAKRNLLFEYSTALLQRARERGDQKSEAKAIDLMGKYGDLSEDDIAQFNKEKFENVDVTISVHKDLEKALLAQLVNGSVDFNKFDATTIEYEEVKDIEDNEDIIEEDNDSTE